MMRLIIANCTLQDHDFIYNLPRKNPTDAPRQRRHLIKAGSQEIVSDDVDSAEIDKIVKQHEAYGLIPAKEITRTKRFVGLCYSIDKPVDVDRIMTAAMHNSTVLSEQHAAIRLQQALVLHDTLQKEEPRSFQGLSVEVVEQGDKSAKPVAEGIRVRSRNSRRNNQQNT